MLGTVLTRACALFFLISSLALAATPTSFCKCICFNDYKIIPLDAPPSSSSSSSSSSPADSPSSAHALFRPRADASASSSADSKADGDGERDGDGDGDGKGEGAPHQGYHHKTCNDCNKVFCLEQNLPECRDATDQDVSAQCFQRDSSKDEAVVFVFIVATLGLLSWALVKPWADGWLQRRRESAQYIPVASDGR